MTVRYAERNIRIDSCGLVIQEAISKSTIAIQTIFALGREDATTDTYIQFKPAAILVNNPGSAGKPQIQNGRKRSRPVFERQLPQT